MNRHRRRADYTSREAVDYADYPNEQLTDAKILDYAAAEQDLTDPGLMHLSEHLERLKEKLDHPGAWASADDLMTGYTESDRRSILEAAIASYERGDNLADYADADREAITDAPSSAFSVAGYPAARLELGAELL